MSHEAVEFAQVLTRHVLKHVDRELEPHKSELGRVMDTNPVLVKIVGKNVTLHADNFYWADGASTGLQLGDWLALTAVEGSYVVHDRVDLGQRVTKWTPLAYATGAGTGNWSDYGSGFEPGSYYRDTQGFVHVRGMSKNASAVSYPATNVVIGTLPVGFRPVYNKMFDAVAFDTASHAVAPVMQAMSDGRIMLGGADVGQVPLGDNGSYQFLAFSTDFGVF